jgi:hypothetical protein
MCRELREAHVHDGRRAGLRRARATHRRCATASRCSGCASTICT